MSIYLKNNLLLLFSKSLNGTIFAERERERERERELIVSKIFYFIKAGLCLKQNPAFRVCTFVPSHRNARKGWGQAYQLGI